MCWYVYIIYSDQHSRYYTGMTANLDRRISEHNEGKNRSTRMHVPWRIIHFEEYVTRIEARSREKYFKSAAGRKWRKKNLIIE